jgi:hypothetical protein
VSDWATVAEAPTSSGPVVTAPAVLIVLPKNTRAVRMFLCQSRMPASVR